MFSFFTTKKKKKKKKHGQVFVMMYIFLIKANVCRTSYNKRCCTYCLLETFHEILLFSRETGYDKKL